MPRDGTNTFYFSYPPVVPSTTIASAVYNTSNNEVVVDLNTARPISVGGTGATTADGALASLGAEKSNQVVVNYDAQAWVSGSFSSALGATGAPPSGGTAVNAFTGTSYVNSAGITLEARDAATGKVYYRSKPTAGAWSAWVLDGSLSFQALDPQLFAGIPINSVGTAYTLVATDAQKCIYTPVSSASVIPANSAVPFPLGTCITFANGAFNSTIAINTDTLNWHNGSIAVTGTRTLPSAGIATAIKVTATSWIISGNGIF
jgi:hypothetical protein